MKHVVSADGEPHELHSLLLFGFIHGQRVVKRRRDCFGIVWIDKQGASRQFLGCASEFAEHQHAAIIGMSGTELFRDEVHAVPERRY